ncbi:carbohydrate ABC transporter permease [Vallitalea okinawensis]|uniref:carbohydrate ABC transporter permease n=1 Tax=Vallitalea okinawensis TaxID=2078660 RepID=UPI000CFCA6F8|nr:carbohydrate ABC transporter permease [Vallitalea okinawensis]
MKILKNLILKVVMYAILLFVVLISIGPILWVMMSSMKSSKDILNHPFTLPEAFNLSGYINVIETTDIVINFANSLIITISATIIALFIYSLSGYIFAKFDFKFKKIMYVVLSLTLLIPSHATSQPIFSLINAIGLYDTRMGLMLVYVARGLAISIFILRTSFYNVPKDLDVAAKIDSANFWQIFYKINLPLVKPGLATAAIMIFLQTWNEFYYGIILTTSSVNRTLPVALQFLNDTLSYNYTNLFAAIVITAVPSIIIYLCMQQRIQESFVTSGLKG